MIVPWTILITLTGVRIIEGITGDQIRQFLTNFGTQVGQTFGHIQNPIQIILQVCNGLGIDSSQTIDLASVACQYPKVGLNPAQLVACTILEHVAAHFLASLGQAYNQNPSNALIWEDPTYYLSGQPYRLSQYRYWFSTVCPKANRQDAWWENVVKKIEMHYAKLACDLLERSAQKYIENFNWLDMDRMLSVHTGITYPNWPGQQIKYEDVSMMIPKICAQSRNQGRQACQFLPSETRRLLSSIGNSVLRPGARNSLQAVRAVNAGYKFKLIRARPFLPGTCTDSRREKRILQKPACDFVLTEHMGLLLVP